MTAATIIPTAIDAYVFMDSIRVIGRHRADLGDITSLADSILDVGLINPITITEDSRLVAGERRLAACRMLGWDSVPVRIVKNLTEASALLRAERDENTCRKDMLPSEKASLGAALEAIEAADARERQRAAGRHFGNGVASAPQDGSYSGGETRDIVGAALGMAGSTYSELSFVRQAATDGDANASERALAQQALADMDAGHGIKSTAAKLRKDLAGEAPARSTPVRTWKPAEQRAGQIKSLAAAGNSSSQIARELGIGEPQVRRLAQREGIRIPADEVVGRARRIDSTRVVREAVLSLDGVVTALALVDYEAVDQAEIEHWAASMTQSMKALNRLNKWLKEMTAQ